MSSQVFVKRGIIFFVGFFNRMEASAKTKETFLSVMFREELKSGFKCELLTTHNFWFA